MKAADVMAVLLIAGLVIHRRNLTTEQRVQANVARAVELREMARLPFPVM
tara:strand:+ start:526 stop:675 length:150 start_codon:yes stop_codon:yes gene_type:complete